MKEESNSEFQEDGELSQILKQPNHLLDKFVEFWTTKMEKSWTEEPRISVPTGKERTFVDTQANQSIIITINVKKEKKLH